MSAELIEVIGYQTDTTTGEGKLGLRLTYLDGHVKEGHLPFPEAPLRIHDICGAYVWRDVGALMLGRRKIGLFNWADGINFAPDDVVDEAIDQYVADRKAGVAR